MAPLLNMIQTSFAAGEIAPSLYARVDLAKYHIAAKLLRNFFVWVHDGASNRTGTMFVGRCKNSNHGFGNRGPLLLSGHLLVSEIGRPERSGLMQRISEA